MSVSEPLTRRLAIGWHIALTTIILLCCLQEKAHSLTLSNLASTTRRGSYYHGTQIQSSSFCSRVALRPATKKTSSSSQLNMFLGQDAGFLGVGAPEIVTIVLVGYFVLGPTELYKLTKEIGKFITNIRTLGTEATASFEGAMENQLELQEIRKAQAELADAFSFRRSINVETAEEDTPFAERSLESSVASVAQQETAEVAAIGAVARKKKRRRVKRSKPLEDIDISEDQFETMSTASTEAFEDEAERVRRERLARLEASMEESDRLWGERMRELEPEGIPPTSFAEQTELAKSVMAQQQPMEELSQNQARFQAQLSTDWNQQILSKEKDLEPLAKIMEQLALLEEERVAAINRLEEEYRRKEETEKQFYQRKRDLLESAASEIQQQAYYIPQEVASTQQKEVQELWGSGEA